MVLLSITFALHFLLETAIAVLWLVDPVKSFPMDVSNKQGLAALRILSFALISSGVSALLAIFSSDQTLFALGFLVYHLAVTGDSYINYHPTKKIPGIAHSIFTVLFVLGLIGIF
eukprot:TRINITY_DN1945_c0_g1_i2.p1 TRINITY_DN1945_c0_g1~~TRINITY_DN1945_c0_g1_i2.p1  ORF type:complete len:115 (-),score=11.57 TRINITY_DN1945_c0_g1_i2:184-528(-)